MESTSTVEFVVLAPLRIIYETNVAVILCTVHVTKNDKKISQ